MHKIINQKFKIAYNYNIFFTKNVFEYKNKLLINILNKENKKKKKIIIFIDKKVAFLHKSLTDNIKDYFEKHKAYLDLKSEPILISGGEKIKNHYLLVKCIYKLIEKFKICRQSYIIAIGGGTIQDLIGYVSSTAHRGIKLIRMPTTTLSQDDSGVGVKNGINFSGKKNFIGCFNVPCCVINDYSFLKTLNDKIFMEGLSEAIKVSLIKDKNLFNFINKNFINIKKRNDKYIEKLIYKSAKLHANHISKNGDPFENLSARPLDFGHWIAHKIESLSKYRISHGEGVSIGISLDCTYSYLIKILNKFEWKKIIKTILSLGLPIFTKELLINSEKTNLIFDGLEEFREHLGGRLTITLIKKIGTKIDVHHINKEIYKRSIILLKRLNSKNKNVNQK